MQNADRPLARLCVPGYDMLFPIDADTIEKCNRAFGEGGMEICFKLRGQSE